MMDHFFLRLDRMLMGARRSVTVVGVTVVIIVAFIFVFGVPLKNDIDSCSKYVMTHLSEGVQAYNKHMSTMQNMFSSENKRIWLRMEKIVELNQQLMNEIKEMRKEIRACAKDSILHLVSRKRMMESEKAIMAKEKENIKKEIKEKVGQQENPKLD